MNDREKEIEVESRWERLGIDSFIAHDPLLVNKNMRPKLAKTLSTVRSEWIPIYKVGRSTLRRWMKYGVIKSYFIKAGYVTVV